MNAPAEPYDDEGGLLSGTWSGGHGWLIMIIVPLIPMALILGGFAVNDAGHSRQCTSHGGHTDRVGGTFDDIFLVCRDAQNRITKVYADKGAMPSRRPSAPRKAASSSRTAEAELVK